MARYIDADKLERALREDGILPETTVDRDTEFKFKSAWGIPIVEGNLAHAHWIMSDKHTLNAAIIRDAICSACGGWVKRWIVPADTGLSFTEPYFHIMAQFKYCSFCGAKMDGDIEEEELK